jgi:hypothetical protein
MNSIFQSLKKPGAALLLVLVASCSGAQNTPTGILAFWADESTNVYGACFANGLELKIALDGIDLGPITYRVPEPTKCGDFSDPRAISRVVPEGIHTVTATNGSTCTWAAKDYKVAAGSCTFIKLLVTAPP